MHSRREKEKEIKMEETNVERMMEVVELTAKWHGLAYIQSTLIPIRIRKKKKKITHYIQ